MSVVITKNKNPNLMTEAEQIEFVKEVWYNIRHIKNPSEAAQLAAAREDGYAIHHIKNPSEAVQIAAVQQNEYAIQYIKNPSEAVQLAAVQENGYAIQYIKNPSRKVIYEAIKLGYTDVIWLLGELTDEEKYVLLQHNPMVIDYLDKPTEEMINFAKLIA